MYFVLPTRERHEISMQEDPGNDASTSDKGMIGRRSFVSPYFRPSTAPSLA